MSDNVPRPDDLARRDRIIFRSMFGGGILFLIGAIVFVPIVVIDVLRHVRTMTWPTTSATITESRLENTKRFAGRRGQRTYYKTHVRYTYVVNGTTYTGDRITVSGSKGSPDRDVARKTIRPYPAGRTVTAYYDPSGASYALLKPGLDHGSVFIIMLAAIFLVFGIGLTLTGRIMLKRMEPAGGRRSA